MDKNDSNMAFCSNCEKVFNLKMSKNIYRCGDTYVCSKNCSRERFRELNNIDPGLTRPHTWPIIKSTSTNTLFNSELILNKTPYYTNNFNKHILKNQTKYFDVGYETEEVSPLLVENLEFECSKNDYERNKIVHNCFNKTCKKCLVIGIPSVCAICILFAIANSRTLKH
tara:strand:+ start:5212 stop:5718 length:507 start_codon:yes stop_codon:yes gene_type:complete